MKGIRFTVATPRGWNVAFRLIGTAVAKAQTLAMGEAATGFKGAIRGVVRQNFRRTPQNARRYGLNFEKSFKAITYPDPKRKRYSFDPVDYFVAGARYAGIFEEGGTVATQRYRPIALRAAQRLGLDYGMFDRGAGERFSKRSQLEPVVEDLRFGQPRYIPVSAGRFIIGVDAAAVASRGLKPRGKKRNWVPLFLMDRTPVRLPKKLSFVALAKLWHVQLPDLVKKYLKAPK